MPDFKSLPKEYQNVLDLAQEEHRIEIVPLMELKGGRTGARLYLASVSKTGGSSPEHFVLKIDRIHPKAKGGEIQRHKSAMSEAPPDFAQGHMANIAFEVEHEGLVAIFYTIAGQTLLHFQPLGGHEQQSQLETIFRATHDYLLENWNAAATFEQAIHPRTLLSRWLGYRLKTGGPIDRFLEEGFRIHPETEGLVIHGQVYPNPLAYGRNESLWGGTRPIDTLAGFQHGDLNIGNILVKFAEDQEILEGYFLIDFALYKPGMPLFYDQRYLEMSYLLRELSRVGSPKWVEMVTGFALQDIPNPKQVPVELAGVCAVINAGRESFHRWVQARHPSLHDDLWGQFWLAGVAAGLNYCNKTMLPEEERLAGMVFAAAHMKRFSEQFKTQSPSEVGLLYGEGHPAEKRGAPRPLASAGSPPISLPAQLTSFIGRELEVGQVRDLLLWEDVRLLTLTGPGGTGKTRLGVHVARELAGEFEHGVVFIPLAELTDTNLVTVKIAQGLGVREGGSQSLMQILQSYLWDKELLLLLDNFEQVTSAAPRLAELLAAAPHVKAMVTSRILLNLQGEFEYHVPPLNVPEPGRAQSLDQLTQSEAVQLFIDRAKAAMPNFSVSQASAQSIAEICQRLDGLPLAIELAAARTRLLSPQEMLRRLDDRLKLLSGGARDLPARQQTLRNTIDWSYDLLEPDQKTLFAHLGIFLGGFSLEAAEAVCDLGEGMDVLNGVEGLVKNSLLAQENTRGGYTRFRMLETIREYALEKLEASGTASQLRERHGNYFSEKMGVLLFSNQLFSSEGGYWLDWIEQEYENLRSVLSWCRSHEESIWRGVLTVGGLFWYWYRRGQFSEGREWCQWALTTPYGKGLTPVRGYALLFGGIMAMWQGDLRTAQSMIEEGLTVWQTLEEDSGISIGLLFQGFVQLNQGEDDSAKTCLEQALVLFKELDQPWQQADTLVHLGNAALGRGDLEEADMRLAEAEAVSRDVGDNWLIAFVLNNYGEVARVRGNYPQAEKYYRESETLLRNEGDRGGDLARLVHSQGYVAQRQGELKLAEQRFQESLAMFRKFGNKRGIAECLAGIAGLWGEQGNADQGARLLSAAQSLLSASGATWWPADRVEYERNLETIRGALEEEAYQTAWEAGRTMDLEEAIERATNSE
jgi:predicted ATPase